MGRRPKIIDQEGIQCVCCGEEFAETEFHSSSTSSRLYSNLGKIPVCKRCIDRLYNYYLELYESNNIKESEKKAVIRICMLLDIYYSDAVFNSAVKKYETGNYSSLIASYLVVSALKQNKKHCYDTTLLKIEEESNTINDYGEEEDEDIKENTVKFFGKGFTKDDYRFLQKEYDDWTSRHECNVKSQEEIFKQICFTQLELLKASRLGLDTKDLKASFLKQLEAANLQPKQNQGETTAETQTFGTLIDKWENTRPIPEIDEDLKDVDNIGLYLDVFFRGHLAKMMGLKNGLSRLYDKYMKKYTVTKPEYEDDDNNEALFDAIFGNASDMEDS